MQGMEGILFTLLGSPPTACNPDEEIERIVETTLPIEGLELLQLRSYRKCLRAGKRVTLIWFLFGMRPN